MTVSRSRSYSEMPPPLEPIANVDASVGLAAIAAAGTGPSGGVTDQPSRPEIPDVVRPVGSMPTRRATVGRNRRGADVSRRRFEIHRAQWAAGVDVPDEGGRVRLVDDEGAVREKRRPRHRARWRRSANGRVRLPIPALQCSLGREVEDACRPGLDQCAVEHVARDHFDPQTNSGLLPCVEEVQRLVTPRRTKAPSGLTSTLQIGCSLSIRPISARVTWCRR